MDKSPLYWRFGDDPDREPPPYGYQFDRRKPGASQRALREAAEVFGEAAAQPLSDRRETHDLPCGGQVNLLVGPHACYGTVAFGDARALIVEDLSREAVTPLAPQEARSLQGLVGGQSVKEIAPELDCKAASVRKYARAGLDKLGISGQTELQGRVSGLLDAG